MTCRFCLDDDWPLLLVQNSCACRGTAGSVHLHCLLRWILHSSQGACGACGALFFLPEEAVDLFTDIAALCTTAVAACVYAVSVIASR